MTDPRSAADVSAARTPGAPPAPGTPPPPRRRLPDHVGKATLASAATLVVLLGLSGGLGALAQVFGGGPITPPAPPSAAPARAAERAPVPSAAPDDDPAPGTYTFRDHELHPDRLFQPYTAGEAVGDPFSARAELIGGFRRFLDVYARRQGEDDNFTVRLTLARSGDDLELYVLRAERALYERTGVADWGEIDRARREATTRLLDGYERSRGLTRADIDVKWGRANQVREARERDLPYLGYEINLARTLGLSLLATEIGTVETFNDDRLVSTVGARSRYQMMPDVLRGGNIRRYSLRTVAAGRVAVAEEHHPLLTMEHAFLVLRGYTNAVGHEMPGLSSYHTGPGNIFGVYRTFLTQGGRYSDATSSVMDAFAWAVTAGYPLVSSTSSFKTYSRGYVASAYGALRATENLPIDPARTYRTDLVSVRAGQSVPLSRLLAALEPAGDVLLTREAEGGRVRFFLPVGAAEALRAAGLDVLDATATQRFDETTFQAGPGEQTDADREYAALVRRTEQLSGFTFLNRARLDALADRFETLALNAPTPYRRAQLAIVRTHRRIWGTDAFEKLAVAAASASGETMLPALPPQPFALAPPDLPATR